MGIYVLKNPSSEGESYGHAADKMSKTYGWIPGVKTFYKSNAKFYRSKSGAWLLRLWGILAIILSTLVLYSILTQHFL